MVSNVSKYIISRETFEKRRHKCEKEYLNVSLHDHTILSTDIYVALEQEVCLPSRSKYIRLIAIILDLPSEYD